MPSPPGEWALEQAAGLLPAVEALAHAAGRVVMAVHETPFEVRGKADLSPVTLADEQAEALITPALQALVPAWPVVAEEAAARGQAPGAARCFWLVDPLDGTREFVARNGEFTVNIALVNEGRPVLGVVLAPARGRMFSGVPGWGAWESTPSWRRALRVRAAPAGGLCLATSRSHGDEAALQAWLQAPGRPAVASRAQVGSSLKFGLIAAGEADLYVRLGPTMEWDTAAGHAVLEAAGGSVCGLDGEVLRYGKPGFRNPHFVARGGPPEAPVAPVAPG